MAATLDSVGKVARRRRWKFIGFNLLFVLLGILPMLSRFAKIGWTFATVVLFVLFVILLMQVVYGFTLAMTGWWVLRQKGDPLRINQTLPPHPNASELSPTAIVMPIFHEDVGRVFQGLRVMYESLQATGQAGAFDLFILSDSSDPNHWIAEEKAWFELCKQVQGFGHIFYRKRHLQQHNKSGNIADFCRRWGVKYRFMIVLDADSLMTGPTFVRLAQLMEQNPQVGIIQTNTKLVLGHSLFQRVNQFACYAYRPMFITGANYWQLGNANYYGHNAIIRIKPFMKHCAMPELPPTGPLGRRILSHDTVEAAFMQRAGYEVWSDYDLAGSYEESPPHLLASLQRDRRWCHGNLQHLWLLFARGLNFPSRINILIGIMAYANAPLWFLFLALSPLFYLVEQSSTANVVLFAYVMSLLIVPKFLAAWWLAASGEQLKTSASRPKIFMSVIAETIISTILAPILMLFYTQFVWASLFGAVVRWGHQKRKDDEGPTWQEFASVHWGHTFFAITVAAVIVGLAPAMLPCLILVLIGPIVSIPFSRLLASNTLGQSFARRGWFTIPEETHPPGELQQLRQPFDVPSYPSGFNQSYASDHGLLQAVLDPYVNAIHVSLLHEPTQVHIDAHVNMNDLSDRLLINGPHALTPAEKRTLLWDADGMVAAHQKLWCSPATYLHEWWQSAFRIYNESSAREILQTSPRLQ